MEKIKNVVVGAGLSGAVLAERLASQLKEEVLVIDSRDHIAGMMYDFKHSCGITVHRYGPHIFHTSNQKIWDYLSQFTAWHPFCLKPLARIEDKYVSLPFNLNSLRQVFPEELAQHLENKLVEKYGHGTKVPVMKLRGETDPDLQFLGGYVYEKIFEKYTLKQWGVSPEKIAPGVMARVPILVSRKDGYFQDTYQAIPAKGYTKLVENMLHHPLITVRLQTPFSTIKNTVQYDRLFYAGSIDAFFDYKYGELPYRSLRFQIEQKETEYYQPAVVVNYPNDVDFTRICEHKYFLDEKTPHTVISVEFPQAFKRGENDPYYPIENPQNAALYARYLADAQKLPGVYFLGRLGAYQYYSMEQTAAAALALFESL